MDTWSRHVPIRVRPLYLIGLPWPQSPAHQTQLPSLTSYWRSQLISAHSHLGSRAPLPGAHDRWSLAPDFPLGPGPPGSCPSMSGLFPNPCRGFSQYTTTSSWDAQTRIPENPDHHPTYGSPPPDDIHPRLWRCAAAGHAITGLLALTPRHHQTTLTRASGAAPQPATPSRACSR